MKRCCVCKLDKTEAEFSKHRRAKDGLQTQCRQCATEYSQRPENKNRRSQQAADRWSNGIVRNARYQHLFGITLEDYYRMLFSQDGVCKICRQKQKPRKTKGGAIVSNLCVDHDHATGKVRGLLCNNCNSIVGFARDNPGWLYKARDYLLKHQKQQEQQT